MIKLEVFCRAGTRLTPADFEDRLAAALQHIASEFELRVTAERAILPPVLELESIRGHSKYGVLYPYFEHGVRTRRYEVFPINNVAQLCRFDGYQVIRGIKGISVPRCDLISRLLKVHGIVWLPWRGGLQAPLTDPLPPALELEQLKADPNYRVLCKPLSQGVKLEILEMTPITNLGELPYLRITGLLDGLKPRTIPASTGRRQRRAMEVEEKRRRMEHEELLRRLLAERGVELR